MREKQYNTVFNGWLATLSPRHTYPCIDQMKIAQGTGIYNSHITLYTGFLGKCPLRLSTYPFFIAPYNENGIKKC